MKRSTFVDLVMPLVIFCNRRQPWVHYSFRDVSKSCHAMILDFRCVTFISHALSVIDLIGVSYQRISSNSIIVF